MTERKDDPKISKEDSILTWVKVEIWIDGRGFRKYFQRNPIPYTDRLRQKPHPTRLKDDAIYTLLCCFLSCSWNYPLHEEKLRIQFSSCHSFHMKSRFVFCLDFQEYLTKGGWSTHHFPRWAESCVSGVSEDVASSKRPSLTPWVHVSWCAFTAQQTVPSPYLLKLFPNCSVPLDYQPYEFRDCPSYSLQYLLCPATT